MEGLSQDTSRFSHRNSHSRRRARVDIVPLIDVMFLLVAFFMLLSISMVFQKGISVDLSVSGTSETNSEQLEPLVISITSLGEYFLGENRISR
ncbi:MAG: biopolymer transporter ExbD, partial [Bdellovibrionales bacterium]|nr:biopolymer transporter ExbD [Bdellovibrionales bacterium]